MDYLIGLDIGTTSTKAVAFDLNGKIIADHAIGYPILNPEPSHFEQDPEKIFQAVISSIGIVVSSLRLKLPEAKLVGVSFSSAMHSLIAVDTSGKLLTRCIIWADTRSKVQAERIKKSSIGHDVYMKTGTPVHPMSPLCKLVWMKENLATVFDAAFKFISIKEYVFHKLFGKYIMDYSIASATGLFDIYSFRWHQVSLELAGISEGNLSKPVPIYHIEKGISAEYTEIMGIDSLTPFVIGGSDGCLANLGSQAVNPGEAAVTIGTSGAIRVIAAQPCSDEKERIFNYILTPEKYVLGGPVNNGGVILRWFKENFAALETKESETDGISPYDKIIERALTIPPGAEGLVFLPYLYGERAPHWNAAAKGMFFGIQAHHTRDHFARALLEGIIFGIYSVGKALEETTGKIDVIFANGGFARSKEWIQMLCDVFNTKVYITESHESSALGAAMVGMEALGYLKSMEEAKALVPKSSEFTPNLGNHEIYQQNFQLFERLYEKLKDEFGQ